jgi:hypothetical protein
MRDTCYRRRHRRRRRNTANALTNPAQAEFQRIDRKSDEAGPCVIIVPAASYPYRCAKDIPIVRNVRAPTTTAPRTAPKNTYFQSRRNSRDADADRRWCKARRPPRSCSHSPGVSKGFSRDSNSSSVTRRSRLNQAIAVSLLRNRLRVRHSEERSDVGISSFGDTNMRSPRRWRASR